MNLLELEAQDIQVKNLNTFQVSDYIALSFFKNLQWLDYELELVKGKREEAVRIGIIGFGDLGKRMLQSALVMNIISVEQKIEYHVWGDTGTYQEKHRGLNDEHLQPDKIVFHREDVSSGLEFLENFDVILLCGQQAENLQVLSDLLRLTAFVGRGGRNVCLCGERGYSEYIPDHAYCCQTEISGAGNHIPCGGTAVSNHAAVEERFS